MTPVEGGGGAAAVRDLPTGTVTYLFSDIEGSTQILAAVGDRYEPVLAIHGQLIRSAVDDHSGIVVNTEGDAFFVVFRTAIEAVRCAAEVQRAFDLEAWPHDVMIRIRIGIHTGEGRLGGDDYAGMDVNRAARIANAGHGGQVLLSDASKALVETQLPDGMELRDMGKHRLKDLPRPEHLWQLDIRGLASQFQTLRSDDARPNNLPMVATPLVGRRREITDVRQLLETHRMVTLTGPGGTGKSRLARTVGKELLDTKPDGVYFVALQDADDRTAVASRIATVIDARERPGLDVERRVKEDLRSKDLLLVLDNLEQAPDAGPLIVELLEAAPAVAVLVTSRAPLRVSGEQEFRVPSMAVPDIEDLPPLEALSEYESVALFTARAQAVRPDFQINADNAPAVAEICARLDGLPLAIELAALRVRLLTPHAILARLEQSLPLLQGGRKDRPERQQTLRGAIAWSYDLLGEPERRLFERLALFAGGWTLDAAEQVCADRRDDGIDIFEGLSSLAEKSLIQADQDIADEPRFRMLQVIREYATERFVLDPDVDTWRHAHAHYYVELAERAEPELTGEALRRWQLRLRQDKDNIQTALQWTIERSEADLGLRLGGALWRFWHYWAEVQDGSAWLSSVLALPQATSTNEARARALSASAALHYWLGQVATAAGLYAEAVEIRRELDDSLALADALYDSFWTTAELGAVDQAFAIADEALDSYRASGDRGGVATMTAVRDGTTFLEREGSADAAIESTGAAIAVNRDLGRALRAAEMLTAHAHIQFVAGQLEPALASGIEALRAFDLLGHLGRRRGCLLFIAAVESSMGRAQRAATLATAARGKDADAGHEVALSLFTVDDPIAEDRKALSGDAFAAAVDLGRSMTSDEAVKFAIDQPT